jgi:large subunit ribosomal protein L24
MLTRNIKNKASKVKTLKSATPFSHIKKGDNVIVITGKDKGKTGIVSQSLPDMGRVVVEGVNLVKKHVKAKSANQKGEIVTIAKSIHASNVKKA